MINWREQLAQFLDRTAKSGLNWSRPAARHLHRNLYLPSHRNTGLSIAIAVDTSGSTDDLVMEFVAEFKTILDVYPSYDIIWLECDWRVTRAARFSDASPPPDALPPLLGGGGTNLDAPFQWLHSNGVQPNAMVYFTDGLGPTSQRPPAWPVLWALPKDASPPAPWGRPVWISESHQAAKRFLTHASAIRHFDGRHRNPE